MAGGNIPSQLVPVFQQASAKYGIPAPVLAGLASVESGFNPNAVSPAGAQGITQFMPGTAQQYGVNVRDPVSSIMGTARYLTDLGFHQNPTKALASYNAGPGNYQAGLGYAQNVLAAAQQYSHLDGGKTAAGTATLPPLTGGSLPSLSVDIPTFDQAGYAKAQKGYVLGQFLKQQSNPFDTGKGSDIGPSALGALYQKGVLSTKAPNRADFQGTRTVQMQQHALGSLATAHDSLQQIAGTQLTPHPALAKALGLAQSLLGTPYNMGGHDAINATIAQVKKLGTDCSGYVSALLGPNGLGIWHSSYATPSIGTAPNIHPGQGQQITLWNNPQPGAQGHVFVQFNVRGTTRWFEEAGGVGAHEMTPAQAQAYLNTRSYQPYHPAGY